MFSQLKKEFENQKKYFLYILPPAIYMHSQDVDKNMILDIVDHVKTNEKQINENLNKNRYTLFNVENDDKIISEQMFPNYYDEVEEFFSYLKNLKDKNLIYCYIRFVEINVVCVLVIKRNVKCNSCFKIETSEVKYNVCPICKKVKYCSKKCQINGWNEHKKICG